jgi:YHS domain-containing protein
LNLPVSKVPVSDLPVLNQEARNPVRGMASEREWSEYKSEHKGSEVYFCAGCKQTFDWQPAKYASMCT